MLRDLLLVLVNLNSWEVDLDADYVVNLCLVKKIKGAFCPHFTACSKLTGIRTASNSIKVIILKEGLNLRSITDFSALERRLVEHKLMIWL